MQDLTKPRTTLFKAARSSTAEQSFEETSQMAYSHGLESIYSLQTVDVKTIRRIDQKEERSKEPEAEGGQELISEELELDLGDALRAWIPPIYLEEPIQSLQLPMLAEKALLDAGIFLIRDLMLKPIEAHNLKGLGPGHQREVNSRLESFLKGKPKYQTYTIDFASWIRVILGSQDRKKAALFLKDYGLEELFPLTPNQLAEVKRISPEITYDWTEAVREKIATDANRMKVMQQIERITRAFILPWMHGREGAASEYEICEHLFRLSDKPAIAEKALRLISEQFFHGETVFDLLLHAVEDKVFAASIADLHAFQEMEQTVLGYFYHQRAAYPLEQLKKLTLAERIDRSEPFQESLLERVLFLSSRFRVRKERCGQKVVRLAFPKFSS